MEDEFNGNSDCMDQEIKTKNIILKNLVNYSPKTYQSYIGSNYKTFFFGDRYRQEDGVCTINPINTIIIYKQFSLNCQAKILKKWFVDFKNAAFMYKSNELIVLCDQEIQKWKIDCSSNLDLDFQTILKYPVECFNSHGDFFQDPYQIQLGTKKDWIAASKSNYIFFLQKDINGTWNCIQKMNIPFLEFILNEQGNILLIQYFKQYKNYQKIDLQYVVYTENSKKEWAIIKKIDVDQIDMFTF